MSEYQHYEWQTIGRLLTPQEQMEVDDLLEFRSRINTLAEKYANRKALIQRWQHQGWL